MRQEESLDIRETQHVVFRLSDETYGIDIGQVQEIITYQAVTRVPRAPGFVEGVINLRGNVIPVLDLRKRFEMEVADRDRETRIIVVEIGKQVVGLTVDAVAEVLRISSDSIEPPSAVVSTADSACLQGVAKIDGKLVVLLNLDHLLDQREQVQLAASQAS